MKGRYILLLVAMAALLILFLYCLIRKTNHVPAGYLCAALSLVLLVCTGWLLLFEESPYPVPVLNAYSDASWAHLREWKQYAQNARLLDMESRDNQNVYLPGVGHISLTDLSLASPFLTFVLDGFKTSKAPQETLKKINAICLAFLDDHLNF